MYSYTFYVALFICCAQVLSMEIPDNLYDKYAIECMEKVNADKASLEKYLNEKFHMVKGDAKLNEYLACMGKSKGFFKEDDKLNPTAIHENVMSTILPLMKKSGDQHEIATKVTDECIHTTGDNHGDIVANLFNCIVDAIGKH